MPRDIERHAPRLPTRGLLAGLAITIIFALAILATFSSLVFKESAPRFLGMYDHWCQNLPNRFLMDRAIQSGELPLWNPLTFCGTPMAAHPAWHPFYPFNLLRSVLTVDPTPLGTHHSLVALVAFHVLLAGVSCYGLARDHGISRPGSVATGFAFIFGGAFVRRVVANHFIKSLAWLPLLVLLARKVLTAETWGAKLRYGVLAGLIFGFSVLGGPPQINYYTGIYLALYAVVFLALEDDGRGRGRSHAARRAVGSMACLALVCLIGALIAAVSLIPAAEFAALSARGSADVEVRIADETPYSWLTVCQNLFLYPGSESALWRIRLGGVGVLLLALGSFFHRRRRLVLSAWLLFGFFLLCSLGPEWGVTAFVHGAAPFELGPWGRAIVIAALPISLLAGFGVDGCSRALATKAGRWCRAFVLLVIGGAMLVALGRWVDEFRFFDPPVGAVGVPAALLGVMIAIGARRTLHGGRVLLVTLLLAESVLWARPYAKFLMEERGKHGPLARLQATSEFWSDNQRGIDPKPNRILYELQPAMNGYDPLFIADVRQVICAPSRDERYNRTVRGEDVTAKNLRGLLFLKRSFWLARQWVEGPLPEKRELFPATTTVFLDGAEDLEVPQVSPSSVKGTSVSENTERVKVLGKGKKNARDLGEETKLPAFTTGGKHAALVFEYSNSDRVMLETRLLNVATGETLQGRRTRVDPTGTGTAKLEVPLPDWFEIQATILAEGSPVRIHSAQVLLDQDDEGDRIHLLSRGLNKVELELQDVPGPRVLTFLDAAYPGWTATLDGSPVPILKANEAFKAIAVPAGTHQVTFEFKPEPVRNGALISVATLLACLVFLGWPRHRDPNQVSNGV